MDSKLVTTTKSKSKAKPKALAVGDRVTFTGDVLRVLGGEERSLLVMIEGSADKVVRTIKASTKEILPRHDRIFGGGRNCKRRSDHICSDRISRCHVRHLNLLRKYWQLTAGRQHL